MQTTKTLVSMSFGLPKPAGMSTSALASSSAPNRIFPAPCNIGSLRPPHSSRHNSAVEAQRRESVEPITRALSGEVVSEAPFLEPFVRSFILGMGAGALLEGGHVALQVLAGSFPGVSDYSPLLFADHVTAFASWIALYAIEAVAIMAVLQRHDLQSSAAVAKEIGNLRTLPKKMLPLRTHIFKSLFNAGKTVQGALSTSSPRPSISTPPAVAAQASTNDSSIVNTTSTATPTVDVFCAATSSTDTETDTATARPVSRVTRSPGVGTILPRIPSPRGPRPDRNDDQQDPHAVQHAKRAKELRDREGYLKNVWYAAALSEKVGKDPVKVQLCGKEMVLWRDPATGGVQCIDNTCPHRGAPLSEGWIGEKEGHSCVVCPYHGWAMDGDGAVHDVPAAVNKGEWPKRPLMDSYPVEEKGGFVWLFYGSKRLPADARPPIPFTPELEDPSWKPVYEEIEFDCNAFGVFENAIDMAHIHYLHSDSFGNQDAPEIRDMEAAADAYSVTATFKIQNKPVNAFWALFKVPVVEVTAKAMLPSTSLVSFTLANGLSFITFVNTTPISATKSINRFALVRKLSWDKTGLFNASLWDGMARQAMLKIQLEDKEMVEQLKYDQLIAEYSVRADLPQVMYRRLRQQWVDLVGVVPNEEERPPYTISNKNM